MVKASRVSLLALAVLATAPVALAHAVLVSSSPSEENTIYPGDLKVDLHFNSRVDGVHSTLSLVTPGGRVMPLSLQQQPSPSELLAHATTSTPGTYQIRWQALAGDGHITRGVIQFRVR